MSRDMSAADMDGHAFREYVFGRMKEFRDGTMKKMLVSGAAAIMIVIYAAAGYSQDESEYLVCQDIEGFKNYRCECGSGILAPADHFVADHDDLSCNVTYHSMAQ